MGEGLRFEWEGHLAPVEGDGLAVGDGPGVRVAEVPLVLLGAQWGLVAELKPLHSLCHGYVFLTWICFCTHLKQKDKPE